MRMYLENKRFDQLHQEMRIEPNIGTLSEMVRLAYGHEDAWQGGAISDEREDITLED